MSSAAARLRLSLTSLAGISSRLLALAPALLLAAALAFEWTAIRAINHGRFIYSLDDPYIHLSLAERIARGFYGINPGEAAGPSSSALWPLLLVPFARTAFFEYVPLALNILAAFATLFVYTKFVGEALDDLPVKFHAAAKAGLVMLLIPATNLVGLVYTGMEHSLQLFLCAAMLLGLVRVVRGRAAPGWLAPAMIAAALVRYECLALVVPGLILLALRRQWKPAALALGGVLLGLGAFSLFLHAQGVGWLPTSVLAKVNFAGAHPTSNFIRDHLLYNLDLTQGRVLGALLLLVWLACARKSTPWIERAFALGMAGAVLAHLSAGQVGWWDRYEVYMVAAALLAVLFLGRDLLIWLFRQFNAPFALLILFSLTFFSARPYYNNFFDTPGATANIYEQQYQMHRFVVDYLKAPAAVNDLGWVAFRNPYPVLDLWGLASPEALQNRTHTSDPAWMERMVTRRGVRVALLYETWFPHLPSSWIPVAQLHLGHPLYSAGNSTVTVYALDPAEVEPLTTQLRAFAPTLPPGVRLTIAP